MSSFLQRSLSWLIYPFVVSGAVLIYLGLQKIYPGEIWTAYGPILLAALVVIVVEKCLPQQQQWQPDKQDVKTDVVFMLLIQVALPLVIGLAAVSLIYNDMAGLTQSAIAIWPHHWPLLAQAALMLFSAELINYWVHRLSHTVPLLWRFHAVHHSPEKLYWLNVGRFHPVEKIWQYLLITLPFIFIRVHQEVIGLYFVFYAVNGFFQHSNIKIKYGVLNYLVSSAELHRWHHSPIPKESNNNYGNNLIVWDLIFGSWFLPKDRRITQVGSGVEDYPQGFRQLMVKPFTSLLNNVLLPVCIKYIGMKYWQPFIKSSHNPRQVQQNTLRAIMRRNQYTEFGQRYDFNTIHNHTELGKKLPISGYEDIEASIRKQAATGRAVLHHQDALFYARTSGTTGRPKDIPITRNALRQYKQQQSMLSYYQYQTCPQAFSGRALGVVSPTVEGQTDSGNPYGSVSGYIYKSMPGFVRDRYLVPAEVFDISDYELKYRIIIRLALAETNITYLGTANPTTFLRMRDILNEDWAMFLASLENGVLPGIEELSPSLQEILKPRIKPEPTIYQELRQLSGQSEVEYKDIWPGIRMITTWTGGNCRIAMQRLLDSLPATIKVIELGYVATEFRATMTCDAKTNAGIPLLEQMYYEFVEKNDWETGVRETLAVEQLEQGRAYYPVVTTDYGLYRYFINDLVEVCGFFNKTPLLRFLQKGKGVTNITGEKLYEAQTNRAIEAVCKKHKLMPRFYMTLANAVNAYYQIYLEIEGYTTSNNYVLATEIDDAIAANNIEYALKRKSGRLRAPHVHFVSRGCGDAYKKHQISRGQREGQYKLVTLQDKTEFSFDIDKYLMDDNGETGHVSNF